MRRSKNAPAGGRATALAVAIATLLAVSGLTRSSVGDEHKEPTLLGPTTREAVEAAEPEWVAAEVAAMPDEAAAQELAAVEPGAAVTVYLGTWCSDSRRELSRFWRAVDEAGGEVPFTVEYVAVDRAAKRPPELEREQGLRWVPTFIVRRGGEEVGRVVEVSPHGIEKDLLALLDGDLHGVVSGRADLGAEAGTATP